MQVRDVFVIAVIARPSTKSRALRRNVADMARPRIYQEERVTTAIRLPKSVHARLHEAAGERGVSANHLILVALDDFLDRLIPVEDMRYTRPDEQSEPRAS